MAPRRTRQPARTFDRLAHARRRSSATFEALEDRQLLAQTPTLLADLGGADSADYKVGVVVGDEFFFAGNGPEGEELWKSDGTAAGTKLVKDIRPGSASSIPFDSQMTNVGGILYFNVDDGIHDSEVWRSDGTDAGTYILKDINPTGVTGPYHLTNAGGTLMFTANTPFNGYELWVSNGTEAGTKLLKDLRPGSEGSFPSGFFDAGTYTYFTTARAVNGGWIDSLWRTDETAVGTIQLVELPAMDMHFNWPVEDSGNVYYLSYSVAETKVWKTDGTLNGTGILAGIPAAQALDYRAGLTKFDGALYYSAATSEHGTELFKYDLATGASVLVADIHAGTGSSAPDTLVVAGDLLYFTADDGVHGRELWQTDGTAEGTRLVTDIRPGADGANPAQLRSFNGRLIFEADDGVHGVELWKTDGTPAGLSLLKDVNLGPSSVQISVADAGADTLFFIDRSSSAGATLWKTDGTSEGTEQVRIVSAKSLLDPNVTEAFRFGDSIYNATATGLWRVPDQGTPTLVTPNRVSEMMEVDGRFFFTMSPIYYTKYLAISDGTPEGTQILHTAQANGVGDFYLTEVDDRVYFNSNGDLWASDGTVEGTVLVKYVGASSYARLTQLTNVGGELLFVERSNNLQQPRPLWKSDGTEAGTVRLDPDADWEMTDQLVKAGGLLFYTANDDAHGTELWATDGTLAGTRLVKDIEPGEGSSSPTALTNVAGRLYFFANDTAGRQIWTSDGTEAGTHVVYDIEFPDFNEGWPPAEILGIGDTVYFTLDDGTHGDELWVAKVGQTGAQLLADIDPAGSSQPRELTNINGRLYFVAGEEGARRLWTSDGTEAGTVQVFDGQAPQLLMNVAGSLVFTAFGETGRDPWIIRPPAVVGRHLFYNGSAFDGGSGAAEAADDGAIAPDKSAYLPGTGSATTASVSSYVHGINGVMIDIAGLEGVLTADDFIFRMGASNAPETWTLAPQPLEIVVRAGAGENGSDRVTITWANGAIKNTWLQVVVKGNDAIGEFDADTGLAASDVFFFGSRVGDTFEGATASATVTSVRDELAARNAQGINQSLTSLLDFNRDGVVSLLDQLIARNNAGLLMMIDVDDLADSLFAANSADAQDALAFALAIGDDIERGEELTHDAWRGRSRPKP